VVKIQRLLIVSNRLPVTIAKRDHKISYKKSVGGLATGLGSFYESYDSVWIGWCGLDADRISGTDKEKIKRRLISDYKCYPVSLNRTDIDKYYRGFCNKTVWPLFHCFTQYAVWDDRLWEHYKRVNRKFAETVAEIAKPDDIIWVHDYQLMLLPKFLREKLPDAQIGFFLHIPFPPLEVFNLLPWRDEVLEGLLGADLVGFHTYHYARNFLEITRHIKGYEHKFGDIATDGRTVRVDCFPMGIDFERFEKAVENKKTKRNVTKFRKELGDRKIIVSVDRLDYTKGIVNRLKAFGLFLARNPEFRGKVTWIMLAVPSRTKVEHYKQLKSKIDELVGKINGKYSGLGWIPIWYLYRSVQFEELIAMYNIADVCLVTPIKDGMNLVAKEFLATKTDGKGVLILSENAGAACELGEAIIINPNNKVEIANAIKKALSMPVEEQIKRNEVMRERLKRYNVTRWAIDFMDILDEMDKLRDKFRKKIFTKKNKKKLVERYRKAKNRLLLLDYDGTLVAFDNKPLNAMPEGGLIETIKTLANDPKNEVVIISGRDKSTLEKWFGELNIGLVAEHGVWLREPSGNWETIEHLDDDWKKNIRPILEQFVDRTPKSFIEEKEFSLVWHYRKADPNLAEIRASDLNDAIMHLTAHTDISAMEGNKVIEIKKTGINKGRTASRWVSKRDWDFIVSIGDDRTDEDVFAILPDYAYSIKVGQGTTGAKFTIENEKEVRKLLKELGES